MADTEKPRVTELHVCIISGLGWLESNRTAYAGEKVGDQRPYSRTESEFCHVCASFGHRSTVTTIELTTEIDKNGYETFGWFGKVIGTVRAASILAVRKAQHEA